MIVNIEMLNYELYMLNCGVRFADNSNYFLRKYLNSAFGIFTKGVTYV